MPENKRVLITGHEGYIGSVMAPWFQRQGYDVVGLDTGYFHPCTLVPELARITSVRCDIRDVTVRTLAGYDAIIHLAALSNDPIGSLNEDWTREINAQATVRLAVAAKQAGVSRFVFSSSCIMYGMSNTASADENAPVAPRTEYARSKVEAEVALARLADDKFSPTFCRNGTIYGLSPRMRFDTVLNNLMGYGFTTGEAVIHSDGTPWRPVVHVQDVARAFQAVVEARREVVHNQAFNVGANDLNHQVKELGQVVADTLPGCKLSFVPQPGADQRTYKADFSKFERTFPQFRFSSNVRDGASELRDVFERCGLTFSQFTDKRFTRVTWLRHLLDDGLLRGALRWETPFGKVA